MSKIRDFFVRGLFESEDPKKFLLETDLNLGINDLILKASYLKQNKYHNELLLDHLIEAFKIGRILNPDAIFTLECLFHDIGKVITCKYNEIKQDNTFYNHEYVGALLIYKYMNIWKFSKEDTNRVTNAIRNHQYRIFSNTTDKSIVKWLSKIGPMTWQDIRLLRLVDRQANNQNINKPVIYKEYIEAEERINTLSRNIW